MKHNIMPLMDFDIRLASFLNRKLSIYVARKMAKKKARAELKWVNSFGGSNAMIFNLEADLKIKLYADSILSKFIYQGFEKDEVDFLKRFLLPGDLFIDVGANIGLFSLYASRIVGDFGGVISFEPTQTTYEKLLENCALNNLGNIQAFKLGLSEKEEMLELNVSSNGFEAWNTFVESHDDKFSSKEMVPTKSLDGFISEHEIDPQRISLVKIDVEGFEMNVLRGAQGLLSRSVAPTLMVEFTEINAISAGHCCHEMYKFVNDFGYTWYSYLSDGSRLVYEPMQLSYPYTNLIAIKNIKENIGASKFEIG